MKQPVLLILSLSLVGTVAEVAGQPGSGTLDEPHHRARRHECQETSEPCVTGTVKAELVPSGPDRGLYRYTVVIAWNMEQGLSNFTLDFNLNSCGSAACNLTWLFPEPAGRGTAGEPEGCEFAFTGEFNCNGNPSIGLNGPVLKWELAGGECEAARRGTAVLVFLTDAPPFPGDVPVSLLKNGENVCGGTLEGVTPSACPTPVQSTTWGHIRTLYSGDRRPS